MFKSLLFAFFVASCASHRVQTEAPIFDKNKVCSDEALNYLKQNKLPTSKSKTSEEFVANKMLILHPFVKGCYEAELNRTNQLQTFNLCYVTDFDKNGKQIYSNFSTREAKPSDEFYGCLDQVVKSADLSGLKEVLITQPFLLRFKGSN